jgi:cysteine-S-conjugate beta-lyase
VKYAIKSYYLDNKMEFNFDERLDRSHSDSIKWHYFDADVLPMWVADMDFRSPEAVIRVLSDRVQHGVFGYGSEPEHLREVILERLQRVFEWTVQAEEIVFLPGVITGFNLACHAFSSPGDSVLVQTPVYPPILHAHKGSGLSPLENELLRGDDGRYSVDYDAFEAAIQERTRVFLLCNPHNPVGRVFRRDELERMAEICLRHKVLIVSDEIHGDLVFSESRHIPIATLDPAISANTITLMAPSKTFNIAGLDCSFAVIQDKLLRQQYEAARKGLVGGVNILGFIAAQAAYQAGGRWLEALLEYLQANRDYLVDFVRRELPGIHVAVPEGTYLAWLDCRDLGLEPSACEYFIQRGRVAMNDGSTFGRGGAGFIRLNFGCPRSQLQEALERMKAALSAKS